MIIKTCTNQDIVYLYWIGKYLNNYYLYLGIGTAINDVLMIVVDEDQADLSKKFLANLVFQTIFHLTQDLVDTILANIVQQAAQTMELENLTDNINYLCVHESCNQNKRKEEQELMDNVDSKKVCKVGEQGKTPQGLEAERMRGQHLDQLTTEDYGILIPDTRNDKVPPSLSKRKAPKMVVPGHYHKYKSN